MNLLRRISGKRSRTRVKRNTYPIIDWNGDTPISLGSHWKVTGVNHFASFFRALPFLVPTGSILCLEGGNWYDNDRVVNILNTISLDMESTLPANHNLDYFVGRAEGYYISITKENMAELAELAANSAEIEIALDLTVISDNEIILEWCDLPEPPIYISETIERESVSHFAESVGGKYQKIIFCDNCTFIDL